MQNDTDFENDREMDADTPKEECGVFGIYAPGEDVARLTFFGLFSLQHRGQESAGIAVADGEHIEMEKGMGLVTQVFNEESLKQLHGHIAIGHVRYSTTGSSVVQNAQPLQCILSAGSVAVAHNGNLINTQELREAMQARGIGFETTNDSEIIARLIAEGRESGLSTTDAVRRMMSMVKGAYSLAILTEREVVGVRDPFGVRPLCLGRIEGGINGAGHGPGGDRWVLASETCALHTIDAAFVRELAPGEIVVIDERGLRRERGVPMDREALCMLEMIYFARPDSAVHGLSLHIARQRMGMELAREHPAPGADIVIGVPDSGCACRARLFAGGGHSLRRRVYQKPLHSAHVHTARPANARTWRSHETDPDTRNAQREKSCDGGRFHRPGHHHRKSRAPAFGCGRKGSSRPHFRPAGQVPVLLRD